MALNLNLNLPAGTYIRGEDLGEGFTGTYTLTLTTPNQPGISCEVKIETKPDEGSVYKFCGILVNESMGVSQTVVFVERFVQVTIVITGGTASLNIKGN